MTLRRGVAQCRDAGEGDIEVQVDLDHFRQEGWVLVEEAVPHAALQLALLPVSCWQ